MSAIDVPAQVEVRCVCGSSQSGKTTALCELARERAAEGRDVLFVCASRAAARKARADLPLSCRVGTPFELAMDIVEQASGVRPHLLDSLDERVLLEDLRRTGLGQKRLVALLRFFKRSFADMRDDDPSWIRTGEERMVHDALEEALGFCGGMLASQAPGRAVRALHADELLAARVGADVVVADDFHLMSRASQRLLVALAQSLFALAADDEPLGAAVYPAEEKCPDPDAARSLRDDAFSLGEGVSLGLPDGVGMRCAVDGKMAPSFRDELACVADCIEGALADGAAPCDIAVVSENAPWLSLVEAELCSRGVPVGARSAGESECAALDLRDGRSPAARTVRLRLALDAGDEVALRTWCAFGDYLGNSVAIGRLRESGLSLREALRVLDAGALEGFDAADPLFASVLQRYREACEGAADERTASVVGVVDEGFPGGVFIGSPDQAQGRRFRLVVLGGMVASREDGRAVRACAPAPGCGEDACRRLLEQRAGSLATERLVKTGFEHCSPEEAERLGIAVRRIRLLRGEKVCLAAPRF